MEVKTRHGRGRKRNQEGLLEGGDLKDLETVEEGCVPRREIA